MDWDGRQIVVGRYSRFLGTKISRAHPFFFALPEEVWYYAHIGAAAKSFKDSS